MHKLDGIALVMLAGDRRWLSAAALEDVLDKFSFDQILIFSDSFFYPPPASHIVVTPMRSVADATRVAWREIYPKLNPTVTHILSCHWDGYPINPAGWRKGFLEYDYIGAVWPWFKERSVGNSGFSLQSRKLLELMQTLEINQPEDTTLCRAYRPVLERDHRIIFAPEAIADRFSIEHNPFHPGVFGFHGLWNMIHFKTDEEIKKVLALLEAPQWENPQIDAIATHAMANGRRSLYLYILDQRQAIRQGVKP